MTDQYLVHHGVKGMKWGVRKDRKKRIKEIGDEVIKEGHVYERVYSSKILINPNDYKIIKDEKY